jgi:hypothetical protein
VDTLDQQVDLAGLAQAIDELFLYLVEVIQGQLLGRLRRRTQDLAPSGRAPIKAVEAGGVDGLTDRAAPSAAEVAHRAVDDGALRRASDTGRPQWKQGASALQSSGEAVNAESGNGN